MALQVELQPAAPLKLTPNCTIHTGILRLVMKKFIQSRGAPPDAFGIFLPEVPPLLDDVPEPQVWAEAFVASTASSPTSGFPSGVHHVRAAYLADPAGGNTARWLHLSGAAYIGNEIRLGYRVTVQTV